jgi:hypothetical protein
VGAERTPVTTSLEHRLNPHAQAAAAVDRERSQIISQCELQCTRIQPETIDSAVSWELHEHDPEIPFGEISTMEYHLADQTADSHFTTILLALLTFRRVRALCIRLSTAFPRSIIWHLVAVCVCPPLESRMKGRQRWVRSAPRPQL